MAARPDRIWRFAAAPHKLRAQSNKTIRDGRIIHGE